MATTNEIERHLGRARGVGRMAVVTVDRSRDFVRARRHTWLIAVLRRALPLASVGIVALYGAMMLKTAGLGDALSQLTVPRILPEHLTMNNPRYEGFNSDGGSYVVTAKTARQDLDKEALVRLESIDGDLLDARKTRTNLKATRGTYDNKRAKLELFDGITVVSEDGSKATLQSATVLPKENLVISKLPVLVEMPTGTVRSKEMTLRQKVKQVTFERDVVAHLKPPPKSKDDAGEANAWTATTERAGGSQPARPAPLFGAEDKPIDVTSARLDIDDLKKTAIFTGEVKAVQGESTLTTPELTVLYEADSADGKPAQPAAGLVSGQAASKLSRILAKEPVTMRQNGNEATGQALEYDARTEIATLAGNVIIVSAPDRQAASDRAEFNAKADTALLTGNVVVIQGKNELRGRRLHVDRKAGLTHLSSPAESKAGAGRITARFVQGESADETAKGKAAKAKPVPQAGLAAGAVAAFKTSPGAPIDIEATTLDVDDMVKVAVFRGDVHAVQGDFVVRTAELHAYYTGKSALADPAAGASGEEASKLTRIQAKRKVVVTSKVGQTATGDYADFDTTANLVTLGGDVVLTQGQNVVRGTRLSIDMATGHTRILTEPASGPQTSSAPAAAGAPPPGFPSGAGAFRSGRPSAVFYPKQVREQSAARPGAPKPGAGTSDPAAASSWQSTTGTTAGAAGN